MPVKKPVEDEAENPDIIEVDFKGQTYHCPRNVGALPAGYIVAVDDKRWGHALRFLLGEEWPAFEDSHTVAECFEFMNTYETAAGLRRGE